MFVGGGAFWESEFKGCVDPASLYKRQEVLVSCSLQIKVRVNADTLILFTYISTDRLLPVTHISISPSGP